MHDASSARDVEGDGIVDPDASLLSPEIAARLARLSLLSRRVPHARRRARRVTRRVGAGSDTVDTRPYALGDDPRRIAWHAYARLERLLVRLTADEAPLRLALVVDTSGSMGFGAPTKLRQAARIAAGLAAVAISGEDRAVAIDSSSLGQEVVRAGNGRFGLSRLLSMLDRLAPCGETDLGAAARTVAALAGGRALCVIVSDFFDPAGALAGAEEAHARGHEVALVEVLDPFELAPPELGAMDIEDDETGEILALPPNGARAAYLSALDDHRAAMDHGAAKIGAAVLRVTTRDPFDEIVTTALGLGLLDARCAR